MQDKTQSRKAGEPVLDEQGNSIGGKQITNWEGKPIGDKGLVFFNYIDRCYQAVQCDGSGVIILNLVKQEEAEKLDIYIKEAYDNNQGAHILELIKKILQHAKTLNLIDRYNSSIEYIKDKMKPIGCKTCPYGPYPYGLYQRNQDICHAVYIPGSGKFPGPAATFQTFFNGAVIVKHGNDMRLIQPKEFLDSHKHLDGKNIKERGLKEKFLIKKNPTSTRVEPFKLQNKHSL
ncbi:hypothetical protein [Wolbachia endosymbiont of Pentidionis agamae]|uniref:hypothetical protein n=1 Tax=Wolbachia endosymbiont of Pentidionis agamae TaxID=3110435 RepID=UPI002FD4A334